MAYENTSGLGVIQSYGPYEDSPFDTSVVSFGVEKQVLLPVVAGQEVNAGIDDAVSAQPETVPEGSYVVAAYLYVEEAFTDGATGGLDVTLDGNNLLTDATGTAGQWVEGTAGFTVTADSQFQGDAAAQTAGSGILVVKYMVPPTV